MLQQKVITDKEPVELFGRKGKFHCYIDEFKSFRTPILVLAMMNDVSLSLKLIGRCTTTSRALTENGRHRQQQLENFLAFGLLLVASKVLREITT